jgi:post-segregation antitoxin (ccd killing protein)
VRWASPLARRLAGLRRAAGGPSGENLILCRWELPAPLARGPLCILVCMARLNVYVPDELAEQARSRGLNVSALTQAAIVEELERTSLSAWLDSLPSISRSVNHDAVLAAVDDARDEFGR